MPAAALSRVLRRLREAGLVGGDGDGDVVVGLGRPDDCAVLAGDALGRPTVHTVTAAGGGDRAGGGDECEEGKRAARQRHGAATLLPRSLAEAA